MQSNLKFIMTPLTHILKKLTPESFSSIKALVDHVICIAINKKASDIHFEPYAHEFRIRFRIDGLLYSVMQVNPNSAIPISIRLKVMAKLDIAEKRYPQDGHILFLHDNQQYMLRISTLAIQHGEKIVLRILKSQSDYADISQLGLSGDVLHQYQSALSLPQGFILVCGPTGSGKTVTLYSGLNYIGCHQKNICSIEDPVEIVFPGINQYSVNTKMGLTFARILRSLLRQDPDVIMIGEIRDRETAEIALQAANTGHLVLSTLHSNSNVEAILRLEQMGIPIHLLTFSLQLIISQRLIRLLCPFCKTCVNDPQSASCQKIDMPHAHYIASSCQHCVNGYLGRTAIFELLTVSTNILKTIFSDPSLSVARNQHPIDIKLPTSLRHSGMELVKKGLTSLEELNRVLGF